MPAVLPSGMLGPQYPDGLLWSVQTPTFFRAHMFLICSFYHHRLQGTLQTHKTDHDHPSSLGMGGTLVLEQPNLKGLGL